MGYSLAVSLQVDAAWRRLQVSAAIPAAAASPAAAAGRGCLCVCVRVFVCGALNLAAFSAARVCATHRASDATTAHRTA